MEGHECAFTFSYSVAKKRLRKAHPLQQLPYLKMVCKCLIMFVLCRILCSFVLRFQTFFFNFCLTFDSATRVATSNDTDEESMTSAKCIGSLDFCGFG